MTAGSVITVTTANFRTAVVERSDRTPVLLDFWADWCGPCRTLGPTLEGMAGDYGGAFVLGKVDTEREPDLAMAFQVQGIPFCVLIARGRPVDAFTGVLGESEVARFLAKHGVTAPLAEGEEPPESDPASPAGRLERARLAAASGASPEARSLLEGFPEEDEAADRAARLRDALAFLETPLNPAARGAEGLLAAARDRFLAGDLDGAMEQILAAVAEDKTLQGGLPRRAMLLCFAVIGEQDERCDDYRRRLATLLY